MFRSRTLALGNVVLLIILSSSFSLFSQPLFVLAASQSATPKAAGLPTGYASALAAADRFLQAWQSGDAENGMALLTSRAKKAATTELMDRFFSSSAPSAYEIGQGKLLKHGRYEFPVVLVASKNNHSRRRFSTIISFA